ncbi:MAG: hypothetical protein O8C64_01400 [Candidatus Methanoperedens sp.]|nr:hypothetical protein [Candidatus Methanoperedens sp.]
MIDNSKLREVAGNLPLKEALAVANALVGAFVKNITETITQPSLINLDYADLRAVMERGGISAIGIGEGDGEDRVAKAVSQALAVPLLDISDMLIMDKVPNTKRVIWGAKVDDQLTGRVRVMAVLTGVKSPFMEGQ